MYGESWTKPIKKFKFKLGDEVRVSKSRRTFKKGYLPSWTQDIFTVIKMIPSVPPVYRLQDYIEDEIEGVFYAEELQKVHKSHYKSIWRIFGNYSLSNGFWQSFVTIGSCNYLMRIIST